MCHSELHPTSLHIAAHEWRLLDFEKAFNGPGLWDLANWLGTRTLPDLTRLRQLLVHYVRAGGTHHALTDRGGLPAELWATGWHRMWAATWILDDAAGHPDQLARLDPVGRQLTAAAQLLTC